MKELFIFVFLLILSLSLTQANASQCPDGWDSYSVSGYWMVDNVPCNFTAYYCAYVSPTGILYTRLMSIDFQLPCGIYMLMDANFRDYLYELINDDALENADIPPCPLTAWNFVSERVHCWKIHNDPSNHKTTFEDCGLTGLCRYAYKVCWDYSQNPAVLVKELVYTQSVSGDTCSEDFPLPDDENYPPDEEWTTWCFYWYDPCE